MHGATMKIKDDSGRPVYSHNTKQVSPAGLNKHTHQFIPHR
jgi:hypothetical protein